MLDSGNAVGRSITGGVILERKHIVIAVAAGDAEGWSAHQHARSGNVACIDSVAQSHIAEAASAHVPHCGEASQQGEPRILGSGEGLSWNRVRQLLVAKL